MKFFAKLYLNIQALLFRSYYKLALPDNNLLELSALEQDPPSDAIKENYTGFLKDRLKRFPFWYKGHLDYSQLALAKKDIGAAYASAQAALNLAGSKSQSAAAKKMLAACHLLAGENDQAIALLQEVVQHDQSLPVLEDLAAAYIAAGTFLKAKELFEQIGISKLNPTARAAYDFASYKVSRG